MRLFYSYAHEDAAYRQRLEAHLGGLRRSQLVSDWSNVQILPGMSWRAEIDRALEAADIIVFLVSADFLNSSFIADVEMKRALERHRAGQAMVIPVILRPVDWEHTPLAELQALPAGAQPVSTWDNEDAAWTDVARGIRQLVEQRGGSPAAAPAGPAGAVPMRAMVQHAEVMLWTGRAAEGIGLLDQVLAREMRDVADVIARGRALLLRGRHGEALDLLSKVVAAHPRNTDALICRGGALLALNRAPDAIAELTQALSIGQFPLPWLKGHAHFVRGNAHWAVGDRGKAQKDYDASAKANYALGLVARGNLDLTGNPERALRYFTRALTLAPDLVWAISGKGWAYTQMKRFDEAIVEFNRALQLDPNYASAINGRQQALSRSAADQAKLSTKLKSLFQ